MKSFLSIGLTEFDHPKRGKLYAFTFVHCPHCKRFEVNLGGESFTHECPVAGERVTVPTQLAYRGPKP